mmetsp:Transcript_13775/g.28809  ORF Transcript_13775/g.28809 Transcript_13775/m.28809 type:complete len:203 (-) Transcript_13775:324-932(-)
MEDATFKLQRGSLSLLRFVGIAVRVATGALRSAAGVFCSTTIRDGSTEEVESKELPSRLVSECSHGLLHSGLRALDGGLQERFGLLHGFGLFHPCPRALIPIEEAYKELDDPVDAVVLAEDLLLPRTVVLLDVVEEFQVAAHPVLVPHLPLILGHDVHGAILLPLPDEHVAAALEDISDAADDTEGHLSPHIQALDSREALQ